MHVSVKAHKHDKVGICYSAACSLFSPGLVSEVQMKKKSVEILANLKNIVILDCDKEALYKKVESAPFLRIKISWELNYNSRELAHIFYYFCYTVFNCVRYNKIKLCLLTTKQTISCLI